MTEIAGIMPMWLFILLLVWELTWKALAMWRSARNNQVAWFVCLIIFNTVGLLPIIYLLTNKDKTKE